MRRFIWIPICFVALLVPVVVLAGGGDGGFDGVVSSIESRYHVHATRIPFLGLVSFISRKATHEGVGNLHVAEFENFSAGVDGDELNQLVTEKLGAGWERIIRETHHKGAGVSSADRRGDEQTLIFIRPEGKRMGMFVVDLDGRNLDVVQVSVDPDHLDDDIGRYDHHHHDNTPDSNDSD
jgi:hypothetical protein